ncbi:MAG: hypothetical protein JHC88_00025 [Niveispirillum sp.]|uniref:hypothetical protein n=1 Tax=Asticcacaulis sp. TaxID=1872648 RepID=UPI001A1D9A06|nr:hypothetical protein [Asticcacaulis sp.]MBJ7413854.1 hypothetical protein [Niveispirillum sp.]
MNSFVLKRDAYGTPTHLPNISPWRFARPLNANEAVTVTVPSWAQTMTMAATVDFWVQYGGAAAVIPTVAIIDGSAPELNPIGRQITGGSTLSVISAAAGHIAICFYG